MTQFIKDLSILSNKMHLFYQNFMVDSVKCFPEIKQEARKTRTDSPLPSVLDHQQWNMLITASTVEQPFKDSNCIGSNLG
jgi:hypothetical protein